MTENSENLEFLSTVDVARLMNISCPTSRSLFMRTDFPALKIGKNYKVERRAFEKWASERHI